MRENENKKLNRSFLDTFKDCLLEQIVIFSTRKNKTLDLFITNKPSLVSKCKPLPGLLDHDIVMRDNKILCTRQKPIQRTIYLWKNVDIVNMKIDTDTLSSNILKHKHDLQKYIENIWNQLKQGIDNIINKNLPSKQSSATVTNPWANTTIKKLSRRKKKAYNKARRSNSEQDWEKYKRLQSLSQKPTDRHITSTYTISSVQS